MQFGRFEVLRRIAVGGMAEIYLARETGLAGFHRLSVVKRILPELSTDKGFVDLFLDEARLAARLSHPKIVHIYQLDAEEGTYFIAMEYVPGCDLESLLRAIAGPMPLGDALHIVAEVLEGLQYAHSACDQIGVPLGVVHRDIAPKNILMALDGTCKIVDFGIAKARNKVSVTAPGLVMGTFSYMSPEQASGQPVDRRTDLFAAGAMLYRMVVGQPAYTQEGIQLIEAVRNASYTPPRLVRPDLPREIEVLIGHAMARSPNDRYATAAEMRRDLIGVARKLGAVGDMDSVADLIRMRMPRLEPLVRSWLRAAETGVIAEPDSSGGETAIREPPPPSVVRADGVPRSVWALPDLLASGPEFPIPPIPVGTPIGMHVPEQWDPPPERAPGADEEPQGFIEPTDGPGDSILSEPPTFEPRDHHATPRSSPFGEGPLRTEPSFEEPPEPATIEPRDRYATPRSSPFGEGPLRTEPSFEEPPGPAFEPPVADVTDTPWSSVSLPAQPPAADPLPDAGLQDVPTCAFDESAGTAGGAGQGSGGEGRSDTEESIDLADERSRDSWPFVGDAGSLEALPTRIDPTPIAPEDLLAALDQHLQPESVVLAEDTFEDRVIPGADGLLTGEVTESDAEATAARQMEEAALGQLDGEIDESSSSEVTLVDDRPPGLTGGRRR